jgi:hypothetical protein
MTNPIPQSDQELRRKLEKMQFARRVIDTKLNSKGDVVSADRVEYIPMSDELLDQILQLIHSAITEAKREMVERFDRIIGEYDPSSTGDSDQDYANYIGNRFRQQQRQALTKLTNEIEQS